jgi:P-type Cu2+ transporter
LTNGQPEVTDVVVDGLDNDELLGVLAAVESASEHSHGSSFSCSI